MNQEVVEVDDVAAALDAVTQFTLSSLPEESSEDLSNPYVFRGGKTLLIILHHLNQHIAYSMSVMPCIVM